MFFSDFSPLFLICSLLNRLHLPRNNAIDLISLSLNQLTTILLSVLLVYIDPVFDPGGGEAGVLNNPDGIWRSNSAILLMMLVLGFLVVGNSPWEADDGQYGTDLGIHDIPRFKFQLSLSFVFLFNLSATSWIPAFGGFGEVNTFVVACWTGGTDYIDPVFDTGGGDAGILNHPDDIWWSNTAILLLILVLSFSVVGDSLWDGEDVQIETDLWIHGISSFKFQLSLCFVFLVNLCAIESKLVLYELKLVITIHRELSWNFFLVVIIFQRDILWWCFFLIYGWSYMLLKLNVTIHLLLDIHTSLVGSSVGKGYKSGGFLYKDLCNNDGRLVDPDGVVKEWGNDQTYTFDPGGNDNSSCNLYSFVLLGITDYDHGHVYDFAHMLCQFVFSFMSSRIEIRLMMLATSLVPPFAFLLSTTVSVLSVSLELRIATCVASLSRDFPLGPQQLLKLTCFSNLPPWLPVLLVLGCLIVYSIEFVIFCLFVVLSL